ncbi:transposase [Streptomonospora sp. S1-112]|uniref:Transposase n=1 Tax=Streptomonospora mangrovi TaxID=2883123 RepID=A0A9X3NY50_9ACTN|nr:transposase [Streptomonospora mangrovi]MDA0566496.1 transposase [Streptomonospora mangrovi]
MTWFAGMVTSAVAATARLGGANARAGFVERLRQRRRADKRCSVVRRHEITDTAWEQIAPLLPANRGRGGRWADHRTMLNGMLYKIVTGCPWRELPQRYGPWQSIYGRYRRWAADGTFDVIWPHVQRGDDAVSRIRWQAGLGPTAAPAQAHTFGARRKEPLPSQSPHTPSDTSEAS